MPRPRPTVKFDLLAATTFNETLPDWVKPDSTIGQELKDAILLYANEVLHYPLYELPVTPPIDTNTAKGLVNSFLVWRDVKFNLTQDEQQYFWDLDVDARAKLHQLPPTGYVEQLRFGFQSNLTSREFIASTESAIKRNREEGQYQQDVDSLRSSLDALALQIQKDKYNEDLTDNYMTIHYNLQDLKKQVASA